ncbi:MAG: hypothetical protein AAGF24_10205 [Cyanobacteria bacterium P01_H01_bin.121]
MLQVGLDDIQQWRSQLADYPDVMRSLDAIADCEGDVEDATVNLAIFADLEPDNSDRWLASLAKRYRPIVCDSEFRASLKDGDVVYLVRHLFEISDCPPVLVLPIAVQVMHEGLDNFCQGFN